MTNGISAAWRPLLAEFVGTTGARHYSLHMIGGKDGVYYIALAVPEA